MCVGNFVMTLKNKIMTKKFITLIMAVLLPLSAFQMSADEKEAKPIPIKKSLVNHMTRTQYSLPIESYFPVKIQIKLDSLILV